MMFKKQLSRMWRIFNNYYRRYESKIDTIFFDYIYGTETWRPLDRTSLDVSENDRKNSWSYEPCGTFRFHRAMRLLKINPKSYTFIDIGSGKGKILLLANKYDFKKIIGMEFSPGLCKIAQENLLLTKNTQIEILNCDARNLVLPNTPCVLFLFNPFQEETMKDFLNKILMQSKNRTNPLLILYVNPTAKQVFVQASQFKKISQEDGITDVIAYQLNI